MMLAESIPVALFIMSVIFFVLFGLYLLIRLISLVLASESGSQK